LYVAQQLGSNQLHLDAGARLRGLEYWKSGQKSAPIWINIIFQSFKKVWKGYVSSKNAIYEKEFGFTGKKFPVI
jgi:hypothetical protein